MPMPRRLLLSFLLPLALPGVALAQDREPARRTVEVSAAGTLAADANYLFNPQVLGIRTLDDNQASVARPGTAIPSAVSIQQTFGGPAVNDGRNALGVALHMLRPTSATNPYRFYAAGNFVADSAFVDGGTAVAPQGFLYGAGTVCRLKPGAMHWRACIGQDSEVSVEAGASVAIKAAFAALAWPDDAVHGSQVDAGYWLSAAPGAAGFTDGIRIDAGAGQFPLATNGTLLRATGGNVRNGIDLTGTRIAGHLLLGDGVIETTSLAAATSPATGALRVGGGIGVGGAGWFGGPVVLPTFTIARLPACTQALRGARANVSDGQDTPQFMGAVKRRGSTFAPVFCNGAGWFYG